MFWEGKFYVRGRRSEPITGTLAGPGLRADFISKIGITVEEADETAYWLELLIDTGIMKRTRLEGLLVEADELVRILQASRTTAKSR